MIKNNLDKLNTSIQEIARSCGRDPGEIKLVAVSKRFPADAIKEARSAGQILFGENYLQEAVEKRATLGDDIELHFIGHLQSNKAKACGECCDMVETVDRYKIAAALDKQCARSGRALNVLIQVNVGRDENKSGVLPEDAEALLARIQGLANLRVRGLMTMPPFTADPEDARPYFRDLRLLSESLRQKGLLGSHGPIELSMGMSHDYAIAIEEGATYIRIGTAIFGQRPPQNTA